MDEREPLPNGNSYAMESIICAMNEVKNREPSRITSIVITKLEEAKLWLRELDINLPPPLKK